MKRIILCGIMLVVNLAVYSQQRVVAECTVTYALTADDSTTDKEWSDALKAGVKTVYIKGFNSRSDLISPSFSQTTFFDKTKGTAVILRVLGNNKFITRLDNAGWAQLNSRFDTSVLTLLAETKTILGYECKKAVLQLKDGHAFALYYAPAIIPSVKEFEYQFKNVPGWVLAYQTQDANGKKVYYTAVKINMNPVPASKFDVPTSGYRELK